MECHKTFKNLPFLMNMSCWKWAFLYAFFFTEFNFFGKNGLILYNLSINFSLWCKIGEVYFFIPDYHGTIIQTGIIF